MVYYRHKEERGESKGQVRKVFFRSSSIQRSETQAEFSAIPLKLQTVLREATRASVEPEAISVHQHTLVCRETARKREIFPRIRDSDEKIGVIDSKKE